MKLKNKNKISEQESRAFTLLKEISYSYEFVNNSIFHKSNNSDIYVKVQNFVHAII